MPIGEDMSVDNWRVRYEQLDRETARLREERDAALEAITPQPISEKHKNGNWWLVWEPFCQRWVKGSWRRRSQMWVRPDDGYVVAPTHALPVPPAPEEKHETD